MLAKIFVCPVLLAVLVGSGVAAQLTQAAKEVLTFTIMNPFEIHDLELNIKNSEIFDFNHCESSVTNFGCTLFHPDLDAKKGTVRFVLPGEGTLLPGTNIMVSITIKSSENDFSLLSGSYTFSGGQPPQDAKVNAKDFKVFTVGDPQNLFTITNLDSTYLTYTNLSFLNNSPELDGLAPFGGPGFTSFSSLLTIAPSATATFLFPELLPGNFLYIEGHEFASDANGNPTGPDIPIRFGHQAPVPEPSFSWLVAVVVSLVGARKLRAE